jgi:cholesterol oxidase
MRCDVAVVGSGFGGAVAALRLAEKGYRVVVLEAGRRWRPEDFPPTNWRLRRSLWAPRLGWLGIQRLTLLDDVLVLSGAGVGGGSLVYANTLVEPLGPFWDDPQWAGIADWRRELAPHYATARRMLGAATVPEETPADAVVREVARRLGAEETVRPTEVAVFFGEPGVTVADPYFGGEGPPRAGCTHCGGCMVGCRVGAKNSLDRNYLWLAERLGAEVRAETEVRRLRRVDGSWELACVRPGPRPTPLPPVHAEQVVLAAGVLGTVGLLLRSRLPGVSPRLGELVRTNSEAIVGASAPRPAGLSRGVAITSSFRPDAETHVEPVRYPPGSNALGLLGTILVDGGGRLPRPLRFAGLALRRPLVFARSLSVRRWSERTLILLVMQARDNRLRLTLRRGRLRSEGADIPTYLPQANEAARHAAAVLGGEPGSALNEVLLDRPTTAHVLGGCAIGADPSTGVVDAYHRVLGCPGLHVVDGSAVPANLGSNPSLTIVALAERALSLWPRRGEDDPRPPLGEAYREVPPVPPERAAAASATPV